MDSTPSPTQAYPDRERHDVLLARKDLVGAEEALSRLAQSAMRDASDRRTGMAASDFSAGLRVTEPLFEATLRPAAVNNDQVPSDRLSLGRRAVRTFARFLLVAGIGVAATLAWQSYSEAAKQMIASWAPQLGWSSSLTLTNPSPDPEVAAKQPSPSAVEATADATPAPPLAQTATASPSPELAQQLARDLATVRQGVDQLTASQEQMARDIAKLQAAEQDLRHKISASPPPPAAPRARKPVPTLPPPQPAPRLSSALPPPALPPPPSRPPMPLP